MSKIPALLISMCNGLSVDLHSETKRSTDLKSYTSSWTTSMDGGGRPSSWASLSNSFFIFSPFATSRQARTTCAFLFTKAQLVDLPIPLSTLYEWAVGKLPARYLVGPVIRMVFPSIEKSPTESIGPHRNDLNFLGEKSALSLLQDELPEV